MQNLQSLIDSLQNFAQKRLNFERPPKLFLKQDEENAQDMLGSTAYYDPQEEAVTIFTAGRHPKDILRSYAHELVHHTQNLRGDLSSEKCGEMGMGYAQDNLHMREMERQAYEQGNMCFRDWEDGLKLQITQINIDLKENKKMAIKISKKELKGLIGKLLETRKIKKKPLVSESSIDEIAGDYGVDFGALDKMAQRKQQLNLKKIGLTMKEMQRLVGVKADGVYGRNTIAAIEKFQKKNGLAADGVFGPKTFAAATDPRVGGEDRMMTQLVPDPEAEFTLGDEEAMHDALDDYDKDMAPMAGMIGKGDAGVSPQAAEDELVAVAGGKPSSAFGATTGTPDELLGLSNMKPEPFDSLDIPAPKVSNIKRPARKSTRTAQIPTRESKAQTPEKEKALNESLFGKKNNEVFNRLKELWTK